MPVQACLFDHVIMASSVEYALIRHNQHDDVNDNARKYMKSVKTGYGEKDKKKKRSLFNN